MADLNIPLRITEIREESADASSIFFERPPNFLYESGDWLDIRFPTPEFPVGRSYSFASSPTEPELRITFRRGVSPFKKRLEGARLGEVMLITQYGSNGFRLDRGCPAIFIAGGVGITPFRSMLKQLVDTDYRLPITLFYQNGAADFPFRSEIDTWMESYPTLRTHYRNTRASGRLTAMTFKDLLPGVSAQCTYQPRCYVAGPPGMVDHVTAILRCLGFSGYDIIVEHFTGY